MKKNIVLQKRHKAVRLICLERVRAKDLYTARPILEANTLIYDSTGKGKPLYIPDKVLRQASYPDAIPLIFGHENKHIELGYLNNFIYDGVDKVLRADIHVYPRWNAWVLRKLSEGINGLSTEFNAIEKDEGYMNRILHLTLERVAIVLNPASHRAKFY